MSRLEYLAYLERHGERPDEMFNWDNIEEDWEDYLD